MAPRGPRSVRTHLFSPANVQTRHTEVTTTDYTQPLPDLGPWKKTIRDDQDGDNPDPIHLFAPFNVRECSFVIDDALNYISVPPATKVKKHIETVAMTKEEAAAWRRSGRSQAVGDGLD